MMQTQLNIYQYNASGAVTSSFNVDLYEDIPFPVVRSVADIKEPQNRVGDYTKTITIPGTAANNALFSMIFDLSRSTINVSGTNFTPDFNPNLKADAAVLRNGIVHMRGYLQLNAIKDYESHIDYECTIIGRLPNLFQDLGDSLLQDLDLSAYNHAWNYSNVANSWANYIQKNGAPYTNFDVSGNPTGEGYVYPLIDNFIDGVAYDVTEKTFQLEQMRPAVYLKQVIDKIFSEAGYRYSSAFFDSVRFKRLIVPYTNGRFRLSTNDVEERRWKLSSGTNNAVRSSTNVAGSPYYKVTFDTIDKDSTPSGADLANDKFVIQSGNGGKYSGRITGTLRMTNTDPATQAGLFLFGFDLYRYKSGITTIVHHADFTDNTVHNIASGAYEDIPFVANFPLNAGDAGAEYYVMFNFADVGLQTNLFTAQILAGVEWSMSANAELSQGNTVDIASALPEKVKQADLLTWIIKMFNLYLEPDTIDSKKLIIEPRDDFYSSTVLDLTDYLDRSREIESKPMGLLDFKVFEMRYKEDKDEFNEKYQRVFNEPYATRRKEVTNDFIKDTLSVEVGFAASPAGDSGDHDRIYTKIKSVDINTQKPISGSFQPRLLYYGGLVPTTSGWNLVHSSGTAVLSDFPYAGMVDNITSPTFDLGFAQPKAINYGGYLTQLTITNANLYNIYWKRTIEEITDKDSKLVTAYFKLSDVQLANISFRNIVLVDRQYYRLHSVEYDLNSNDTAKVELLKLKTAQSFSSTTGTINGGSGELAGEGTPQFVKYGNNDTRVKSEIYTLNILEEQAAIPLKTGMVYLDTDAVLPSAEATKDEISNKSVVITICNTGTSIIDVSGNSILPGTAAVFTGDGVSWTRITDDPGTEVVSVSADTSVDMKTYTILVGGNYNINFPASADMILNGRSVEVTVKNAGSGGDIVTLNPGSGNIDGAASMTLAKNEVKTVISDGTNLWTK